MFPVYGFEQTVRYLEQTWCIGYHRAWCCCPVLYLDDNQMLRYWDNVVIDSLPCDVFPRVGNVSLVALSDNIEMYLWYDIRSPYPIIHEVIFVLIIFQQSAIAKHFVALSTNAVSIQHHIIINCACSSYLSLFSVTNNSWWVLTPPVWIAGLV